MKLGLLGAGGIARSVIRAAQENHLANTTFVGIAASSVSSVRAKALAEEVGTDHLTVTELLSRQPDWILEVAGVTALENHLSDIVASKTNLIIMSIGALVDAKLWKLVELHRSRGYRVILPSGAIGGLDAVQALAATGQLTVASITTSKSPSGLIGAPYLIDNAITLPEDEAILVFDGTAREAIKGFPANVNVSVALSLSGIGPDKTRVKIISDPFIKQTSHEIYAQGAAGSVSVKIQTLPNPMNPRSSFLASLSAINTLQKIQNE